MSTDNFSDDRDIMEIIDEQDEPVCNSESYDDLSEEDTVKQGIVVTLDLVTSYLQQSNIPIIHDKKERDKQIIIWLNEYHAITDNTERKQYLRDCVILNTFFLLPWVLSSKHLPAPLFEDAIQTIIINLMRAIENYTPNSNTKFSSYISGYIKDGIKIAVNKEQTITVPIHRRHKINQLNKINMSHQYTLPEVVMFYDTIISDTDIPYINNPETKLLDKEECINGKDSTVMPYLSSSYEVKYGHLFKDVVNDLNAPHYSRLLATLKFLVSTDCNLLSDYERDVILYHYGLFGYPKYNLDDIVKLLADKYDYRVSKPRVSQISKRGVDKLKRYFNSLSIDIPKLF